MLCTDIFCYTRFNNNNMWDLHSVSVYNIYGVLNMSFRARVL